MRSLARNALRLCALLLAGAAGAQPAPAERAGDAADERDDANDEAPPRPRREARLHMFSAADDRAERERARAAAGRRRAAGEPEVLELPGVPDAYFYRSGVSRRARVYVYLHARNADPRESCRQFSEVVPRFGWLVCPVGPGIGREGRRQWNNNPTVARQYAVAAVNALFRRFPRRARVTDNVIMGFSEGAFVAMQTGLQEPVMFPRWVIFAAHDRYIAGESALFASARPAVRKIYLLTGEHDEIVEHTRRAATALRRERLGRVELRVLDGAGHQLPPDFAPAVRRALQWVTR